MPASSFSYDALRIQQTPTSKPIYLIGCDAKEILQWCDVPRSKSQFMAGYQRELADRHEKISEFIREDPANNIIPNAVLVALKEENFELEEESSGDVVKIKIKIGDLDFSKKLDDLISSLENRLSDTEKSSIEGNPENSTESIDADSEDESVEATSEDDIVVDDASVPPDSYMAQLVGELKDARTNLSKLDAEKKKAVQDLVEGLSKPGLILDGQHRVFGAKDVSEFDMKFPVVLLPGIHPKEQVFHFYVLNNKAKPVDRTHLRRIISTALSKGEIDTLYDRFKQAGVEASNAEWTHRMNHQDLSPFKGLIKQFKDGDGSIDEAVAFQVVSRFMSLGNRHRQLVDGLAIWNDDQDNHRLRCFYRLWAAIKDKYPNAWRNAAENGPSGDGVGQMFYKVNLLILQEYVLDNLNREMPKNNAKGIESPLADPEKLYDEVNYIFPYLSEDFFTKEWKRKGLDTSTGRSFFRDELNKAIDAQSKNLGNMRLFKG